MTSLGYVCTYILTSPRLHPRLKNGTKGWAVGLEIDSCYSPAQWTLVLPLPASTKNDASQLVLTTFFAIINVDGGPAFCVDTG